MIFTVAAIVVANLVGDPLGALFEHVLTGPVVLVMIAWAVVAMSARRFFVGPLPKYVVDSKPLRLWTVSRLSGLFSAIVLLASFLLALTFGLPAKQKIFHSLILVIVLTAFSGIIGGSIYNCALVIRHWRTRVI